MAALERGVPGEADNIVDDQPATTGDFVGEMARVIGAPRPLAVPFGWAASPATMPPGSGM
ncbi:MAG: hypothetical protein ACRDZ4_20100 [Egibacteraceae bacterium]